MENKANTNTNTNTNINIDKCNCLSQEEKGKCAFCAHDYFDTCTLPDEVFSDRLVPENAYGCDQKCRFWVCSECAEQEDLVIELDPPSPRRHESDAPSFRRRYRGVTYRVDGVTKICDRFTTLGQVLSNELPSFTSPRRGDELNVIDRAIARAEAEHKRLKKTSLVRIRVEKSVWDGQSHFDKSGAFTDVEETEIFADRHGKTWKIEHSGSLQTLIDPSGYERHNEHIPGIGQLDYSWFEPSGDGFRELVETCDGDIQIGAYE